MKKLLAALTFLAILVSFAACYNPKTDNKPDDNSATPAPDVQTVFVSTENFPKNTIIQVETVNDDTRVKSILTAAQSVEIYDINAVLNNEKVQPSGEVEVAFPIPADYDLERHIIEVYYISDDGICEKINAEITADAVVAKLKHFSVYVVAIIEKPTFNLVLDGEPSVADGQKALISDKNLTVAFNQGDTWRDFANKNKDTGFLIDKDFYGEKDIVYYVDNEMRYQVVNAIGLIEVKPDEPIEKSSYACMTPHRETLQGQWFYEVSNEPFMVEGYLEPFDRQGKTIIIDTSSMTYTIKHIKLQKISALSHVAQESVIAAGKYTSDDGDTLGATLTFDNGYVIKTSRSKPFEITLIIDGKSITGKTADRYNFYEF